MGIVRNISESNPQDFRQSPVMQRMAAKDAERCMKAIEKYKQKLKNKTTPDCVIKK